MQTKDQVPWIDYIVINEDLSRTLRPDTPRDIREMYERHIEEIANSTEMIEK